MNFSREMISRLGYDAYFAYVSRRQTVFAQLKPDPVGLHKLMDDLQVSARNRHAIGDSDTDILTGRNAWALLLAASLTDSAPRRSERFLRIGFSNVDLREAHRRCSTAGGKCRSIRIEPWSPT